MHNAPVSMHHERRCSLTFQNEESLRFFAMKIAESACDGA
jgi:hypothetical protein